MGLLLFRGWGMGRLEDLGGLLYGFPNPASLFFGIQRLASKKPGGAEERFG